jgi:hypothetical protein
MRRAIAGACASCITNFAFYPIDTMRLSRQVSLNNVIPTFPKLYAGLRIDTIGTLFGTFAYFEVYEKMYKNIGGVMCIPIASFFAVCISALILAPISVLKKNEQNRVNRFASRKNVTFSTFTKSYAISILNNLPKNMLKYTIYEILLKIMSVTFPINACGAIAGGVASIAVSIVMTPVDVIRTRVALGLETNPFILVKKYGIKILYSGCYISLVFSFLSNTLGHFLLELWGAR